MSTGGRSPHEMRRKIFKRYIEGRDRPITYLDWCGNRLVDLDGLRLEIRLLLLELAVDPLLHHAQQIIMHILV
jgi:hypothetical protein